MSVEPDVASIAALIGEPARASILGALLNGQAIPAGELAARAHISPQTASAHLAKLVEGAILDVRAVGRRRYYRIANPHVGAALEALAVIAPSPRSRTLGESEQVKALRFARTCYDHLAGTLGVALTDALLDEGMLTRHDETFEATERGSLLLAKWDTQPERLNRGGRVFARPCLDWSERRDHLAGALGAAIAATFFARGWIVRRRSGRAVRLTDEGRRALQRDLGLALEYDTRYAARITASA
jgi:DNA-binding transcriptional ArsR family regulator